MVSDLETFVHDGFKINVARKVFTDFSICSLRLKVFLRKELVSDLKTFAHKRCKIAAQKSIFFLQMLPY